MVEIKKIKVWPIAKFYTVYMAVFGLLGSIFVFIVSRFLPLTNTGVYTPMGPSILIAGPIFYGILGFLIGIVSAFFYNLVAKYIGGIQIELDKK